MNETFLVAVEAVCPMLILIIVGYFAAKTSLIDAPMSKKLSALVINLAQPCMLFNALTSVEYSEDKVKTGLLTIAIGLLSHVILAVFAFFAAKYQKEPKARKITEFSLVFVNAGFLGIPLLQTILGDIGRFWCGFYVVAFNLSVWSYGLLVLARGRSDIRMNFRKAVLNMGTVPCFIGLIFYILQIHLPAPIGSAVNFMNNLCTPLVLLVIGANLARLPFREVFGDWRLYLFAFLRLLAAPALIALLYHLCGMADDRVVFFGVMASLPTAAVTVMFAELYDERPDLAARTVSLSTVLSMVTIPLSVLITGLILKL